MKRRRTRKKQLGPFFWLVPAVAAGVVVFFVARSRKQFPPSPRREPHLEKRVRINSSQAAQNLERAVDRAVGEEVWVRSVSHSAVTSQHPEYFFDVLVESRAYSRTLSALAQEAKSERLAWHATATRLPGGLQLSEVTLAAGRDPVCRWRLREVSEIVRVAIIIDDLGANLAKAHALLRLDQPLTFSVMPRLSSSAQTAQAAHRAGIEVMLHLPMQPLADSAPDVDPHEIRVGMDKEQVASIIGRDLGTVPYAAGVNNHMGSRATTDRALMTDVMTQLRRRHLFFVDSRTVAGSVALAAAHDEGVPAFYRSVFLDDTRTVAYTLAQLGELRRVAVQRGAALAIGHPYPSTLAALARCLPELAREDIRLVPASSLVSVRK